ncbi:hypothetical protein SAMN02745116_00649 [Pilibacter termitis]|uniref:Uncharacterized protein n=2 Tax=Pilibacter termitis TaxID=263852 RepID=A0A1T4LEZ9_9ENTE|nr:hypothetical protein SAMN02745116_00649 [Pilibacter termitis]
MKTMDYIILSKVFEWKKKNILCEKTTDDLERLVVSSEARKLYQKLRRMHSQELHNGMNHINEFILQND